jgi:hypothetical protein
MAWRLANSLYTYFGQINAMAPARSKISDGTIGDAAHQGTTSDHNPNNFPGWGTDIVTAADVTHDPAHGCDINSIAEALRLSRDARIKYFIWNRRMFSSYWSGGISPWVWRPYYGTNPHTSHGHLSVVGDARADGTHSWSIGSDMFEVDDRKALQQLVHLARAARWGWDTDRAGFIAAGGPAEIWDYAGGMGINEQTRAQVALAAKVDALTTKLDVIAAKLDALSTGTGHSIQDIEDATYRGAQRAESS